MNRYIDKLGRWHVKPVSESNPFPTNNAYIYSFYARMVGLPVQFSEEVTADLVNLDLKPISRHPGIKPPTTPPISHDEYVGLAGLDIMAAQDITFFGESNYWQICDVIVDGKAYVPTPWRKLVIDDVMAAYEELANDPEPNPRKASVKYPVLYPFAFWHRPEQQYFYYRCADRPPGAFRTLYFIIATIVSIKKNDPRNVMLGFKFLKLEQLKLNFIEKALYKLYEKKVNFKQNCRNYFPEDHPILERVLNEYRN